MQPKKSVLVSHMKPNKHRVAVNDLDSNRKIESAMRKKKADELRSYQTAEAQLALFVAKHTSIKSTDHLTKSIKKSVRDSATVSDISMCRTKCAAIIKNVWHPFYKQQLMDDIDALTA